jgi:nicotinate-nucleotide pyrophosphorylase (carboxylating)
MDAAENDATRREASSPGNAPIKAARTGIAEIVRLALEEDIGAGDVTTLATIAPETRARGLVVARGRGVLSGVEVAREVCAAVDPTIRFEPIRRDGEALAAGDLALRLEGPARSLLTLERVLLNFLQRLSGVATLSARYVEAVRGTGVVIADTRKTTPGMRALEKAAVRHGGGVNHRLGLYDACMIKDNHIAAAGSVTAAVVKIREGELWAGAAREGARGGQPQGARAPGAGGPDTNAAGGRAPLRLTVEARTIEEAEEAARLEVDQILLDNMEPEAIRAAVAAIRRLEPRPGAIRIEVSGGVTLETVRAKALPGVDLISVGALTHSAPALDLAMDLELL